MRIDSDGLPSSDPDQVCFSDLQGCNSKRLRAARMCMIVVLTAVCRIAEGCHATYVADAHHHGVGAKMHEFALGALVRLGGGHAPDRRELSLLPPRRMRSDQLQWSRLQSNGADT